ncbi:glyoxalase superfamily protein [Pseudomonas gingeri]|uniref:Bleomycin resistance protein n=1 Tax=Pseudomonas gingeri TaxID=117681 RepID=A0A7Y8CPC3_9PSED|nr:glyoxalase superfamily protein [Pseudomonas gingeri]NWB29474.1 VOC family protein [Pseudomonas gingeri]NWC36919.1 VOC family protein [Pseudomonas gingeri]NWD09105.1 VOC family protein [Pseudomonas gingeri]NWD52520.1 VOC family protein [Pseudomonas gingeri]NWE30373.1 VOC family protein [Pseudomonas gingeri]
MSFGKTTPILRIFNEAEALGFYVDFLGFQVDWRHRFEPQLPLYLQVSKGDCVLHLSEHHGDATPGSALRIETDELVAFREQLLAKGYAQVQPQIQAMPWGSLDMTITDPFGNRLVFTNAICV